MSVLFSKLIIGEILNLKKRKKLKKKIQNIPIIHQSTKAKLTQ